MIKNRYHSKTGAIVVMLLLTAVLFQSVCIAQSPKDDTPCVTINKKDVSVPEDFSITYSIGPQHADWGGQRNLQVKADGETVKEEYPRSLSRQQREANKKVTRYTISPEKVLNIYASVLSCQFFDLQQRYYNKKVHDGATSSMTVTANGKKHYVNVYYYNVKRFNIILDTLRKETDQAP